jgi:hypothetical protein
VPDELWQVWDIALVWHGEPWAEVVPEDDAKLCAGDGAGENTLLIMVLGHEFLGLSIISSTRWISRSI